jgi:CheY-like chemotaxis protein
MLQSVRMTPVTVLIVEHEAIVRLELAHSVSDMGLRVLEACNADEAVIALNAHADVELMLTDIRMPGSMDGIRLAHHVRKRWPKVQIIVLSGMLNTQITQLPADSLFLTKPYDPQGLADALMRMLGTLPRAAIASKASLHV